MVILLTGISSGFGLEMARALSEAGHIVYGTVRREVEHLPGVHYLYADVTDELSVREAVSQLIASEGRIDVFINNAGMGIGGPIEYTSLSDAERQMDVNFYGLVRFVSAVLPHMREQGRGRIIAFSSIGGLMGLPYQGFYSASKFAIEGYCEALRLETRQFGLEVIVIEPGDFNTGFTAARKKSDAAQLAQSYPGYQRSMDSIEHDERHGLTPQYLAGRIVRIVSSRHPAQSYVIASPLQRLAILARRILPSKVFAWVLSLYYKM